MRNKKIAKKLIKNCCIVFLSQYLAEGTGGLAGTAGFGATLSNQVVKEKFVILKFRVR